MAGESAREIARKRREKAERLSRVADRYDRGAAGEEATARALAGLPADWTVLHDVRWPGRRAANIDHVAIGPTGVFVIDSKMWAGTVTVINDVLRQNGYKRETAVAAAADAAIAVSEQVPGLDPYLVKPVLCFVRDQEIRGTVRDVLVCSTATLVQTLISRAALLDDAARRDIRAWLERSLPAAAATVPTPPRWAPPRPAKRAPAPRVARRRASRRSFSSALFGLALVLVVLAFGPQIADGVAQQFASSAPSALGASGAAPKGDGARPLGRSAILPRATRRPPLRVVALRAGTTRSTQGLAPLMSGNRLFGVTLRITNLGKHRWVSQPGTSATVVDALQTEHVATDPYPRVRAGKVCPDVIRLAAGHSLVCEVVAEVSGTQPITAFSLMVGPGVPAAATWRIDRQ
ncbi:MAG TPA: nuclease-related domain-containing protein [Marmoricola sp.]